MEGRRYRKVPKGAWNLLERMQATKAGFGAQDLYTVYEGFGFLYREGGDRIYYHPDHPDMQLAAVGRHKSLAKGYPSTAVKRIGELIRREGLTRENTR